jgi:Flp pilus assembly protein TadD
MRDAAHPISMSRSALLRFLAALLFLAAAGSFAQPKDEPAPPLPAEYSVEAQREYSRGLAQARELIDAKRWNEALARLDELAVQRPREAQARFLRAVAQAESGRTSDALATLRALAADFPELPEPRNNLAVIYAAQGNYAMARAELELALAAAPDYAVARENLGDVYARMAGDEYERAASLDKTNRGVAQKLKQVRDMLVTPAAR